MSRTRKALTYIGLLQDPDRKTGPVELMSMLAFAFCVLLLLKGSYVAAAVAFVAAMALSIAAATQVPQPPRVLHRHEH